MYVKKAALSELEAMMEGLEERLTAFARSGSERKCKLLFNQEFAQHDYAWADVLVSSPAHNALHALTTAGVQRRAGASRKGLVMKLVPHLLLLLLSAGR